jgi:PAS domain S-box-containing protein
MNNNEGHKRERSVSLRYGGVTTLVFVAFTLASQLAQHFVPAAASLFICTTMLSSWLGGAGPGFWAAALSIALFKYSFVSPVHSLNVNAIDVPRMVLFSCTVIFVGSLGALQNRTAKSLRQAHHVLERTVAMLTRSNDALQTENAEHRRVAEQLRLSEAFLAEGEKISHTGSWRWNIDDQTLVWSDEHYRIFGYVPRAAGFDHDSARERLHPDDVVQLREIIRRAIQDHGAFECEYRIVHEDGSVRHLFGTGRPIPSGSQPVAEYIGTTVDITARRHTEDLLRKSEKAFRTLAENLPYTVVRYDLRCERIYVNPAFERQRQIHAADVLNQLLEVGWGGDMSPADYRAIVRKVLETGSPATVNSVWTNLDGSHVYYLIQIVAERDTDGSIVSALAIARDVTEAKEAQRRIEESRRLIQQLADRSEAVREEERKHLARELHDSLAQSLLALRLQIGVLGLQFGKEIPELPVRIKAMVGRVDESIQVVRNAIASLRPVALDLGAIAALEWLVEQFMTETEIPCCFRASVSTIVLPDKQTTAIFRIAQEALRNIARHAQATHVRIGLDLVDAHYLIEIQDNGCGFDPSVRKSKSFGLVGIQERAAMFEGVCDIETAPGQGTRLRVRMPVFSGVEPA